MEAYNIEQDGYHNPPAPLTPMLVDEEGETAAMGTYPVWLRILFGVVGIPMLVVLALLALEFVIIAPRLMENSSNVLAGFAAATVGVAVVALFSLYAWILVQSSVRGYTLLPFWCAQWQTERWTSTRSGGILLLPVLLYVLAVFSMYT